MIDTDTGSRLVYPELPVPLTHGQRVRAAFYSHGCGTRLGDRSRPVGADARRAARAPQSLRAAGPIPLRARDPTRGRSAGRRQPLRYRVAGFRLRAADDVPASPPHSATPRSISLGRQSVSGRGRRHGPTGGSPTRPRRHEQRRHRCADPSTLCHQVSSIASFKDWFESSELPSVGSRYRHYAAASASS